MKWLLPFLLLLCSSAQAAGDIINAGTTSIGIGIYNPTVSVIPSVDLNFATSTYTGARSLVMNGGTVVSDTAAISANTSFTLGSFAGTSIFLDGYFVEVLIYSTKLSDSSLQAAC